MGILRPKREFCSKIGLRGAPENDNIKSSGKFWHEKMRILRARKKFVKISEPKILKGGF